MLIIMLIIKKQLYLCILNLTNKGSGKLKLVEPDIFMGSVLVSLH